MTKAVIFFSKKAQVRLLVSRTKFKFFKKACCQKHAVIVVISE